jgi:hypothetical protein
MITEKKAESTPTLESAKGQLRDMAVVMETEIASVGSAFQGLAGHTDSILKLAAAIVECVENEKISSVLPKVQSLGQAARRFIGERMHASSGILETVATEVKLLRQLSRVAGGQEAIALETKALSVLTNVEAARLGSVGAGFQFLARELADFSKALSEDTQKLASYTQSRRNAIEEVRGILSAELPGMREKLARVEADLDRDLTLLDSRLTQLSSTPARFRLGVEHTSQQIAGVVAAVQAHDITRQQIEHVMEALDLIVRMKNDQAMENGGTADNGGNAASAADREAPQIHAGLTIQIYQLKNVKETVEGWTSQIRLCIGGILEVSASEVAGIAPLVLEQGREVSSHLAHIELLEQQSETYGAKIQHAVGGLSNLIRLVDEHSQKSKVARDRLRMLSFNSIIEAHRLGERAGAILAIAKSIKEISAGWSELADQSAHVMLEIQNLATKTGEVMEAFSEASTDRLHEAQAQTVISLGNLRDAAAFASQQAQQMKVATDKIQMKGGDVGHIGDHLSSCFTSIDFALTAIERVTRQIEVDHPHVKQHYDDTEIEKVFAASYTTEIERSVLHAALGGAPLPMAQQSFAGNSVELF